MSDVEYPQAFAAERAVIGAVLRDPRAVDSVAEWLRPEHFALPRTQAAYRAILAVHARREPPDRLMVVAELGRSGDMADVGGELELIELMREVPHAAHIEHHARLVEAAAIRRRLIEAGGKIVALGYDQGRPLDDVAAASEVELGQAIAGRSAREQSITLRAILSDLADRIGANYGSNGMTGVPTGYGDMDELTGGLQPSDLIILAARPSQGKTSLAISLAYNVALLTGRDRATGEITYSPGLPVGVFSLEMSRDQLSQRILAMHTGIDMQRIRTGNLREDELAAIYTGMGQLSEAPIIINDTPGLNIRDLQRRARKMHATYGLSLLVVDYLQLMSGGKSENRTQEVSEISRGLKALARELDIPVLALSQLSRALETRQSKIPMLSDLRESGAIEQDSDVVMFIYREEIYDKETDKKGIAEIHVAKHRNGPLGIVPLRFVARTTRFENLTRYRPVAGYDDTGDHYDEAA
jgi:replicative DNA helicase